MQLYVRIYQINFRLNRITVLFIALAYGDAYLMGQKRLAEFTNNTKTKINIKRKETFKKFLVLLKSVSESSAKGNFQAFNIKIINSKRFRLI